MTARKLLLEKQRLVGASRLEAAVNEDIAVELLGVVAYVYWVVGLFCILEVWSGFPG